MEGENYIAAENVIQNMTVGNTEDSDFVFIQGIVLDKNDHVIAQLQTPFTISSSDKNRIETIIDSGNIISGYASALYFDLYDRVLLPSTVGGSNPRTGQEKELSEILVYPNPSNNSIFIRGVEEGELIEILDINLGMVLSFKHVNNTPVDISDLNNGIYFVKSGTKAIIRFIKY